MRICIFTETYYPVMGGGETQAQLLAEGLIANGHSVVVLTRRSDALLKKHERYDKVEVYRLGPVGRGQLKKWGLILSGIPMLFHLRKKYDLIFVSGYRIIGLTAVLIGKLLRKPIVLKADSQGEMSGGFFESGLKKFGISQKSLLFRWFLRFRNMILKKANAFSALSPEIASEWTSSGIPSEKVHLIPNSVDMQRFMPVEPSEKNALRKKLGLPPDMIIAIYTGRLVLYKGLLLLLRVWNEIRNKHDNVLLMLVGAGGLDIHNCENELHDYVASNQMEQQVHFTGPVQNVADYLKASDIFVFPTENDAFPSSVVEAMACALPIITTPVGAIQTIITHEENGILVEPGSHKELMEGLDFMISNISQISKLGIAALKTVRDRYSAGCTNEKYISLFQRVINRQGM
jgi:glycosyltransferase involved in cell wall biosynthesis